MLPTIRRYFRRQFDIFLVAYIDDIILISDTEEALHFALTKTVTILTDEPFHLF